MKMNALLHRLLALAGIAMVGLSAPALAIHPLDIGVIGGTGTIGQRIVDEALARGHRVTVFARDPSRVDQDRERLRAVRADALDSAGIATHAAGLDVLVSAVGTGRLADADGSIYLRTAQSLVAALRTLDDRAPRLLVVGGVGSLIAPDGGLVLDRVPAERRPEHLGQKAALDFLRGIDDVKWTYLSPPARIAPGERTGRYRLGDDRLLLDADGAAGISMEDYAVALIDEAESARHVGMRFTVAH